LLPLDRWITLPISSSAGTSQEEARVVTASGTGTYRVLALVAATALLIAAAAAVALLLGGNMGRDAEPLHSSVHSGDFDYVIHRIEATDVIADPEFPDDNVTADGRFVVVKLTVTNVSSGKQTFNSQFNTVSDGTTEYRADDTAWHYVGEAVKDVDPGRSIDAAIVFDVPRGVELQSIVLRDERSAEGVVVPF